MSGNSRTFEYEPVVPSRRGASRDYQPDAPDWPSGQSGSTARNDVGPRARDERAAIVSDSAPPATQRTKLILKGGHAVSYVGLFLFTTVLFFRPYEIIPALSSFKTMAWWTAIFTLAVYVPSQFMLGGNLTSRPREVNLALLLCLAALVSMPLSIDLAMAWEVFNQEFIKAVLMFIVLVNVVNTERRLKGLLLLTLAVSWYLSWYAMSDYRAGKFYDEFDRVKGAIGGMFGNPNDMALHLVTMIPIAVALLMSTRNFAAKMIYGACGALMVVAIVVTFSRGGFIGLIAAALLMAWKFGRRNRFGVLALTAVALLLFLVFAPGSYGTRIFSIFDSGLDASGSHSARNELLTRSVIVTLANPVFGVGIGNFPIVGIRNLVSHNAFTQVGAEMGIAAMMIYTLFMLAPMSRLRRIERETLDGPPASRRFYCLAVGLQASLVGYMTSSFFVSVAYQFYVYYLVGYAVTLRHLYEAQKLPSAAAAGDASAAAAGHGTMAAGREPQARGAFEPSATAGG